MDIRINQSVIAIITTEREKVAGGGVPIIYAENEEEREKIATLISRITFGSVHDLQNGVYIIVRH